MQSEPHFVTRVKAPPRIDTRLVLRVYAAIAIAVGLTITGTGIRGIPGLPRANASLLYIAGMVIVAAGCAAWGLSLNDDPVSRARALRVFGMGHLMLGPMVVMQWGLYWSEQGVPVLVALAPLAIGVLLIALGMPWNQYWGDALSVQRRIRSSYDEHILQIARREERARLARDLHDAVKQQLFVIQTAAATAQARFDDDRDGAREALTQARTAAREATTEMEALLEELQAAPMENVGLVEALKKQCEALALRTGAEVSFEPGSLPAAGSLRPGAHEAVYRVAQEALANVARHARATRVTVSLQATPTRFELRISDNGAGVDSAAGRRGMGLTNMEARASEIGGQLTVTPASPGTDVTLVVPVTHPEVRRAWYAVAMFALVALSSLVFYAIRGNSPERPIQLFALALFAVFVGFQLTVAYWKARRGPSR